MGLASNFKAAIADMVDGVKLAPLWWRVGLEQTITRYRRTVLGPFWLASSTLATAFSLALVFGSIFGGNLKDSFPFILTGVVAWSVTGGMLLEASGTFIVASGIMQVQKLPLSFHAFLQIDRLLINFLHQIIALWVVLAIMRMGGVPHWELILALPVTLITAVALCIPIGMLSVRYRDINFMIGFVAQALFMLTPVFWRRAQISPQMRWIAEYNPFAHLLEIVRQPLLGHPAPLSDWIASLCFMGACIVAAVISLTFFRRRVVFWL